MTELILTEELLLLLDDQEGKSLPVQRHSFECAVAGAVLLDLAFADRIDTDPETLLVIDDTPTGNPLLDRVLSRIAVLESPMNTQAWIRLLEDDVDDIRDEAQAALVAAGIVARKEERVLGVLRAVRYPAAGAGLVGDIKRRLQDVLADDIPDPRDQALLSLVDACGVLGDLFPERNLQDDPRLAILRRIDLIGREVAGTIAETQRSIIQAAQAEASRLGRFRLALAAAASAAVAVTLFAPRIPLPNRYGQGLAERLWLDGTWQEWSGYLLLLLSLAGLAVALIVKRRLAFRVARSLQWRLAHFAIGVGCVLVLFGHTGFRLGANLNAVLMGCYLVVLASGGLSEVALRILSRLQVVGLGTPGKRRRALVRLHVLALCPLPALLAIHILTVYLY